MSIVDRLKRLFGRAKDRATDVAGDIAEKAAPAAAKGVDAAAAGADKITGGKFHDQIETVANRVEGALDRGTDKS